MPPPTNELISDTSLVGGLPTISRGEDWKTAVINRILGNLPPLERGPQNEKTKQPGIPKTSIHEDAIQIISLELLQVLVPMVNNPDVPLDEREVAFKTLKNEFLEELRKNSVLNQYEHHLQNIFVISDSQQRNLLIDSANGYVEAQRQNETSGNLRLSDVDRTRGFYHNAVQKALKSERDKLPKGSSEERRLNGLILHARVKILEAEASNIIKLDPKDRELIKKTRELNHETAQLQYDEAKAKFDEAKAAKESPAVLEQLRLEAAQRKVALQAANVALNSSPQPEEIAAAVALRISTIATESSENDLAIAEANQGLKILMARQKQETPGTAAERAIAKEIADLDQKNATLATTRAKLETEKARLAKIQAPPSAQDIAKGQSIIGKNQAQMREAKQRLAEAQAKFDEWANDNQSQARDLKAQVTIAEARSLLSGFERKAAAGQELRKGFQEYYQQWQDVIANIDPNDPDTWGLGDEAQAAFLQGLASNAGQSINTWEDAIKLMAPLQAVYERQEVRERADERLRIEAEERERQIEERERQIKLEDEAREAEKERIRKEEESLRLQEEGLGRTVESMTSMFAPGAVEGPAQYSTLEPPPANVPPPVENIPVAQAVGSAVPSGGGAPPLGIQELLNKYNGMGGGDPYHESEELDLDGSDNNGEEVIIEEISFMPPHPIRKFTPPVARGAPPVIINIGTGGFGPPII